jgi:glycosyltransferase involved in cell wall biosynthesis
LSETGVSARARDGSVGQAALSPVTSRMRVLAHIHTFNDADVVNATITALQEQTRPPDEILVVDNASSDDTPQQPSLKNATVIRHLENRGTSGAVHTGIGYALEHGYDWIWIFDADSRPEPDALERLLDLYSELSPRLQQEIAFIGCANRDLRDGAPHHASIFDRGGLRKVLPDPGERYYCCHVNIWSGSFYRLAAVRRIGLPNADYVLDWGESEYGYRILKSGYKGLIARDAILHHNVRGFAHLTPIEITRGTATVTIYDLAPIRYYYMSRNRFYFALYHFAEQRWRLVVRELLGQLGLMLPLVVDRPWNHGRHILACLRGLWHGFTGHIAARY